MKAAVAKELRNYKPTEYKLTEPWIHFRNKEGVIFNVRRIQGEYKDVREFFELEGTPLRMPSELKEAVDLAGVVTQEDSLLERRVELSIKKQTAICKAYKEGGVRIQKSVPIPFYSGDELSFIINPNLLSEIIERYPKEKEKDMPEMIVNAKEGRALFTNPEFKHILMLREY
jgi:DNA polymerase III sliding clamp (beta) subunit (PCNA family)